MADLVEVGWGGLDCRVALGRGRRNIIPIFSAADVLNS